MTFMDIFACLIIMFYIILNFIEAKPDIATENHWQIIPFRRTSSCKWRCQHAGNTKHLKGNKKHSQNIPQIPDIQVMHP